MSRCREDRRHHTPGCPVAEEEAHVLLFETAGTLNKGEAARTATLMLS